MKVEVSLLDHLRIFSRNQKNNNGIFQKIETYTFKMLVL